MLKRLRSALNFRRSRFKGKDEPLDYEKNKTALLLESAECNISHGDRLSSSDKKRIARDIASTDPECKWTESVLAEKLGVIQQTVNTWISDIRARQKASRNTVILRLSRLGWLQEKIAETTGITRGRIAQIVNNTNFGEINILLSQGRDMDYIARHYNMDLPLENSKSLAGGCAHGINGILTNVMNDSETIGLGGYRLSSLLTHCSTLQNPVILLLI
jgi:plasmid maintenance system antidote protein VapI